MRIFHCDHCRSTIFFENTYCTKCGHQLAYLPDLKLLASLDRVDGSSEGRYKQEKLWSTPASRGKGRTYRFCKNDSDHSICNWAVPAEDPNPYCQSCRLTRTIPNLTISSNIRAWHRMEIAKRRLIYSLMEFELPIKTKSEDSAGGLAFEFLGDPPTGARVLTGHADGLITVNIAEADDVERERRRQLLHEPYRTLLGHFRHEVGHYYWDRLIARSPRLDAFRKLFGDETVNYAMALQQHYAKGPKPEWWRQYVSEYASVHPWEDWAETWAHYLHMTDTLETAAVCGLSLQPERPNEPVMEKPQDQPAHKQKFDEIIDNWFPLTYVLNSLNRGMGLPDAYPFVLPNLAVDKLKFVHETICACAGGNVPASAPKD